MGAEVRPGVIFLLGQAGRLDPAPLACGAALVAAAVVAAALYRRRPRARAHAAPWEADAAVHGGSSAPGRAVVICNPIAGRGAAAEAARALREMLRRAGWSVKTHESRHIGHAREIAATAAARGFTHVLSVGGDGQLHEVCNGLRDARALDAIRVGVVPAGTWNGVASSLGVRDAAHAARALTSDRCAQLDVWAVATRPSRAQPTVAVLSVGWGALADADVLSEREWRWMGALRRLVVPLYVLARHRRHAGRIWLRPATGTAAQRATLAHAIARGRLHARAGGPAGCTHATRADEFLLAHACNVAYMARGILLAPAAAPDDGCLSLLLVRHGAGRRVALRAYLALERGGHVALPGVELYACTALVVEVTAGTDDFAIDGEPVRAEAVSITRALGPKGRPQAVRVAVPPSRRAATSPPGQPVRDPGPPDAPGGVGRADGTPSDGAAGATIAATPTDAAVAHRAWHTRARSR